MCVWQAMGLKPPPATTTTSRFDIAQAQRGENFRIKKDDRVENEKREGEKDPARKIRIFR